MYRLLIDTCVWLNLAKDYRGEPILYALEQLCDQGEVELIVPNLVREEFDRNKDRARDENQRKLKSHVKLARQAVEAFTKEEDRATALQALDNTKLQLGANHDVTRDMVTRIEELLVNPRAIPVENTAIHGSAAARRALEKSAPFHRNKNSVADAIIFEIYAEMVEEGREEGDIIFGFVTHNTHDFSHPHGDNQLPHPDMALAFGNQRSHYIIDEVKFIEEIAPELIEEHDIGYDPTPLFRSLREVLDEENRLSMAVWYDRHMMRQGRIDAGEIKVRAEHQYSRNPCKPDEILDNVWAGALATAERTRAELGDENLGPWSDFDWGMINGKLSALRWVLGDEWDMLDT